MPLRRLLIAFCLLCCAIQTVASQTTSLTPFALTSADLQKLRWIEGSWRGTGGGVPPFFERYRFETPTLLVVETLEGEKVTSTSRYELKGGEFASGSDSSRSVATAFDAQSITFQFAGTGRGGFRWQRDNADAWKAILTWPANAGRPAGERTYQMERRR